MLFIGHWKFDIGHFTFFSLQTPTGPPAGGSCQVFGQDLKKVSPFAKVKPLKPIQCKISKEKFTTKALHRAMEIRYWKFYIFFFTNADRSASRRTLSGFRAVSKKVSPLRKVKPLKRIQCKISNEKCFRNAPLWTLKIRYWIFYIFFFKNADSLPAGGLVRFLRSI